MKSEFLSLPMAPGLPVFLAIGQELLFPPRYSQLWLSDVIRVVRTQAQNICLNIAGTEVPHAQKPGETRRNLENIKIQVCCAWTNMLLETFRNAKFICWDEYPQKSMQDKGY